MISWTQSLAYEREKQANNNKNSLLNALVALEAQLGDFTQESDIPSES